jgi:acyl-CoA thioesterase-1
MPPIGLVSVVVASWVGKFLQGTTTQGYDRYKISEARAWLWFLLRGQHGMGFRHCAYRIAGLWLLALGLASCDGGCDGAGPDRSGRAESRASQGMDQTFSASKPTQTLVFLGDSLTAGYRLAPDEAFPAQVEALLKARGVSGWSVVNAGVSGDTSRGGLERLGWVLKSQPAAVFVCLGANDGLRGLSLEATRQNLEDIISEVKSLGSRVLLGGMELPENYGPTYRDEFRQMYQSIARDHEVPLLPFLLENMALQVDLTLDDGIHPNARGAQVIAENVYRFLQEELFHEEP